MEGFPNPDMKSNQDTNQTQDHTEQPQYTVYPTGAPGAVPKPPRNSRRSEKRRMPFVPVLVSILLTFSLTTGLFYTLYAQGILAPMFAGTAADTNLPESGVNTGGQPGIGISVNTDDPETMIAAQKLASMLEIIRNNYYHELSEAEILNALVTGIAEGMDSPYTYYLTADEYQSMQQSMQGSYSGIGATVSWNQAGYNEIIDVTPNGPAEESGVLPGDIPIEVDGVSVEDFTDPSQLSAIVRGEEGTPVTIVFYRPSVNNYVTIKMVRRTVETITVTSKMMDDGIGYIKITSFIQDLLPQFKEAVDGLVAEGAEHIIFDLRNNSGGSADSLIKVLDYLLPEGEIARTVGREDGEPFTEVWKSEAGAGVPDSMRYAVLVNENSASASELFAGALRDWGKAVLVGQNTYGKGSGTTTYRLQDGSALNLTIFEYILPSGTRVEGVGLPPDIESELADEAKTVPLNRLPEEDDNQLQDALEYFSSGAALPSMPAA